MGERPVLANMVPQNWVLSLAIKGHAAISQANFCIEAQIAGQFSVCSRMLSHVGELAQTFSTEWNEFSFTNAHKMGSHFCIISVLWHTGINMANYFEGRWVRRGSWWRCSLLRLAQWTETVWDTIDGHALHCERWETGQCIPPFNTWVHCLANKNM